MVYMQKKEQFVPTSGQNCIFYMVYIEETFFPRFIALYKQTSKEILSSRVCNAMDCCMYFTLFYYFIFLFFFFIFYFFFIYKALLVIVIVLNNLDSKSVAY